MQLVLFAACGTSGAKGSDASAGLDAPSSGGAGGGGGAGGQASGDANADVAGDAGSGGGAGIDGTAGAGNTGGGSGSGGKGGGAGIGGTAGAGNSSGNGGSGGNGGGSGGSGAGGGGGGPTQARIVDNFEQMGVDVQAPRFAWVVNDSARAEVQTAYQIIVAADEATITANQGTLWDSGKVASAQQYGVTYAGPALAKTTKYWWKVRTLEQGGPRVALERRQHVRHRLLSADRLGSRRPVDSPPPVHQRGDRHPCDVSQVLFDRQAGEASLSLCDGARAIRGLDERQEGRQP